MSDDICPWCDQYLISTSVHAVGCPYGEGERLRAARDAATLRAEAAERREAALREAVVRVLTAAVYIHDQSQSGGGRPNVIGYEFHRPNEIDDLRAALARTDVDPSRARRP